jgi:DNA-binding response OmpR family regulator
MYTSKIKVLIVDDDTLLGNSVMEELNKRGYDAMYLSSVYGISEAINRFVPDVLVFDVEIGKEDGIQVTMDLFKGSPALPIIFISSHHEDETKTAGLMAGAVAYLDKPFSAKLLSAHIDRFTRMSKNASDIHSHIIPVGNGQLDTKNRTLISDKGSIIDLRTMEFIILEKLVSQINENVTREELYYAIWGNSTAFYNEQSLNNYIRRLRTIIEQAHIGMEIVLHRGLGYKLKEK